MGLGDRQVLVVARIRDDRLAPLRHCRPSAARQVEVVHRLVAADRDRLPHLQVQAVRLVELGRRRVLRPGAVQRVEVEARRPTLEQFARRDVIAERHVGLVEREVVVEELTEVRVAGRNPGGTTAALGHRLGDLQPTGAGRSHPGEAERWRTGRGIADQPRLSTPDGLAQQSLADDEETLRTMPFHDDLPKIESLETSRRPRVRTNLWRASHARCDASITVSRRLQASPSATRRTTLPRLPEARLRSNAAVASDSPKVESIGTRSSPASTSRPSSTSCSRLGSTMKKMPSPDGSAATDTSRPGSASSAGARSRSSPPTVSKTTSTDLSASSRDPWPSITSCAPSARASSNDDGDAVPTTWAPRHRASCVANRPTPPTAPWMSTRSPDSSRPWMNSACHALSAGSEIAALSTWPIDAGFGASVDAGTTA